MTLYSTPTKLTITSLVLSLYLGIAGSHGTDNDTNADASQQPGKYEKKLGDKGSRAGRAMDRMFNRSKKKSDKSSDAPKTDEPISNASTEGAESDEMGGSGDMGEPKALGKYESRRGQQAQAMGQKIGALEDKFRKARTEAKEKRKKMEKDIKDAASAVKDAAVDAGKFVGGGVVAGGKAIGRGALATAGAAMGSIDAVKNKMTSAAVQMQSSIAKQCPKADLKKFNSDLEAYKQNCNESLGKFISEGSDCINNTTKMKFDIEKLNYQIRNLSADLQDADNNLVDADDMFAQMKTQIADLEAKNTDLDIKIKDMEAANKASATKMKSRPNPNLVPNQRDRRNVGTARRPSGQTTGDQ